MRTPKVDLRKLSHVTTVARLRSYVRAARELNITQSALTRSIQAFEERFEIRIFDRDRSGVRLTPAGKELVARAAKLLDDARQLDQLLEGLTDETTGSSSFGVGVVPAKIFLKPLFIDLVNNHRGIRTNAEIRSVPVLLDMLVTDKIEFFLSVHGALPRSAPVTVQVLGDVPTAPIVRARHPLVGRRSRSGIGDAKSFPILSGLMTEESENRSMMDLATKWAPTVTTDDHETLKAITLGTEAVWLTSPLIVREDLEAGRLIALPPRTLGTFDRYSLALFTLRGRTLSAASSLVTEKLKKLAGALLVDPVR